MSSLELIVNNLKGIRNLTMKIPNTPGVYLLTGKNGSGKTSLLTCLDRIGNSRAFQDGFPHCALEKIDSYKNATVEFRKNGKSLVYSKGKNRWNPHPRKNATVFLENLGYSGTLYLRADAKRIQISQDSFQSGKIEAAPKDLIEQLDKIFDSSRFDNIKLLKNKNGKRWDKYYFLIEDSSGTFFSEKIFSSGELAVLRLLNELRNVQNNTLILIDEAEIALHPSAQIELVDFLKTLARDKSLTILVSTHSPTIIERHSPNNIFLINGESAENPCYPAKALGFIDSLNNISADFILLFEDTMALLCFDAMVKLLKETNSWNKSYSYCSIPVGGFKQTAEFAVKARKAFPSYSKVKAVLDHDFLEAKNGQDFIDLCRKNHDCICDLGFTPEIKLISLITNRAKELQAWVREEFSVSLEAILRDPEFTAKPEEKPRNAAKRQFNFIVENLHSPKPQEIVKEVLINRLMHSANIDTAKEKVFSILSNHGLKKAELETLEEHAINL